MNKLSEYHQIFAEVEIENQEIRYKTELLCWRLGINYDDISKKINHAIFLDPSLRLHTISFLMIEDCIFNEIKHECRTITELYWKIGEYHLNTLH
jgi:hypothetical protein